jgi:hypothetical protein
MPIYEAQGSLILHFGEGDISISNGRNAEKDFEDELCFTAQPAHRIGEENTEIVGKNTKEVGTAVRMVFEKLESLDVLIEQAMILREKMLRRANCTPYYPAFSDPDLPRKTKELEDSLRNRWNK